MKIALIGADGQLGSDLLRRLSGEDVFPFYYPDFDVTQPDRARLALSRVAPRIIINTSAYHRVDECEDHPRESFLINTVAVRDLAVICRDLDAVLVHFSTDYVFDGQKQKPYIEGDPPNPLNVYALSKLAGEILIRQTLAKYFLIRTCGLYGEAGCKEKGTNFVERIIELEKAGKTLRIVDDQRVTPTSTEELAARLSELIRTSHYGLYHLTNEGDCSWYEFAREVFSLLQKDAGIVPVDSASYGAKAPRPSYSVLENKKAKEVGLMGFSHWRDALKKYLRKRGYIL
jgi:dTDP-4-dehydrorhamnose reductase